MDEYHQILREKKIENGQPSLPSQKRVKRNERYGYIKSHFV